MSATSCIWNCVTARNITAPQQKIVSSQKSNHMQRSPTGPAPGDGMRYQAAAPPLGVYGGGRRFNRFPQHATSPSRQKSTSTRPMLPTRCLKNHAGRHVVAIIKRPLRTCRVATPTQPPF
eukprot:362182-Chlamydomonas_euryale.AAC.12